MRPTGRSTRFSRNRVWRNRICRSRRMRALARLLSTGTWDTSPRRQERLTSAAIRTANRIFHSDIRTAALDSHSCFAPIITDCDALEDGTQICARVLQKCAVCDARNRVTAGLNVRGSAGGPWTSSARNWLRGTDAQAAFEMTGSAGLSTPVDTLGTAPPCAATNPRTPDRARNP
jgi:hypothetical protein